MDGINTSPVSKPFVVSAVVLLFIGSAIGATWAMALNGLPLPSEIIPILSTHKTFQMDGFVALLIMGIGYMIVPRFRNVLLPHKKLAYLSYVLVISSIVLSFTDKIYPTDSLIIFINVLRLGGILIFSAITLWVIRSSPRLLRNADYFIVASIVTFIFLYSSDVFLNDPRPPEQLINIQTWLLFPILMIFGVEYKTLPSFLGFIRPRRRLGIVSISLSLICAAIAIFALFYQQQIIDLVFNIALLGATLSLANTLYVFGGFDNTEIKKLFRGEKKERYQTTVLLTRLSFTFLVAGIAFAVIRWFSPEFAFYDLAIHFTAIGFVGISVMLYLPLMLPPIVNKTIQFIRFNKFPLVMIIASLLMRTASDLLLRSAGEYSTVLKVLGMYGWLVVAAMFVFVIMVHRSMTPIQTNSV